MINILIKIGKTIMKLNDFDRTDVAKKALKESFDISFDPSNLDRVMTAKMLKKVNSLIENAKNSTNFYSKQKEAAYLKLVFMEQALAKHYKVAPAPRIVVENEEVDKSQVILAAQDMIDSVQKMVEQVNDMLVKELPALTDSIQSEIGVNESVTFNQQASEALTSLNQTLSQSKVTLQNALNSMTGVGDPSAFGAAPAGGEEMAVTDIATTELPGGDEISTDDELDVELPADEPEDDITGGVGREKR